MSQKSAPKPPTDGQIVAGLIVSAAVAGATMWAVDAALTSLAQAILSKRAK